MHTCCYLCGSSRSRQRPGIVRDMTELKVLECLDCGLVFLSSMEHIKASFYEDSGMHIQAPDIQTWLRTAANDDQRRFRQFNRCMENKAILDFGCGAGGFLLQARQVASRACGIEVEARLVPHFREQGLEVYTSLGQVDGLFDLITLFHVLEHFADPCSLLLQLADKLKPGGRIIVEVPNANDALLTLYQCEPFSRFTYWSCHLYLFNAATLTRLAEKCGLTVNYLQHIQRYSPANHLHWLAKGQPGGHVNWHFLDSDELSAAYGKTLSDKGISDTLVCSLSLP